MVYLRNLLLLILCVNCLNLFTDGRLFSHIESLFFSDYIYLDNDNIDDMRNPPKDSDDPFILPIINYDNDRKLYSAMILDFEESLDGDDEESFKIFDASVHSTRIKILRADTCVGIVLANLYYMFVPDHSDLILPSDATGGGFIYGITISKRNGTCKSNVSFFVPEFNERLYENLYA